MTLTGKTAIVTGGGTGIGECVSLKVVARGVNVIVSYSRSQAKAEHMTVRCATLGVRSVAIRADVAEGRRLPTSRRGHAGGGRQHRHPREQRRHVEIRTSLGSRGPVRGRLPDRLGDHRLTERGRDDTVMSDPSLDRLSHSANVFIQAIESRPDELFLRSIDEWTPRDVAAHLAWWNRNMIVASQSLQAGTPPSYYADAMNDYRNINARAIVEFPSQDRRVLLNELRATLDDLARYLRSLDSRAWDADHGVQHHRGGVATIRRIVASLAYDYEHHARQVEEWSARVG